MVDVRQTFVAEIVPNNFSVHDGLGSVASGYGTSPSLLHNPIVLTFSVPQSIFLIFVEYISIAPFTGEKSEVIHGQVDRRMVKNIQKMHLYIIVKP